MTVARLRQEVSAGEYLYWSRYHARRAQERELEAKKAGV